MKSSNTFATKTIWITGGAGYLGSAITRELDQQCAKIICFDLPGKAEALVREHALVRTIPVSEDMCDSVSLPEIVDTAIAQHGLPDGVVHLAFASSVGCRLDKLSADDFQKTFAASGTATFILCRALAERMKVRGSGSIVLFASMYGIVAPDPSIYVEPMTTNPVDYGISKAAILQLSRYLAVHYGKDGLRFNCVTPGPFPNPAVQNSHPEFIGNLAKKTVLRRIGNSAEIVGPTLFLLSDSASFVTGHSLVVDGGWTIW